MGWQRTKPSAGPSEADARKIQHAFTNSRLAEINQGSNQDFLKRVVKRELAKELNVKKWDSPEIEKRYWLFTKQLQNAQLTINFKAQGWFANQAGFDEYKTMYDFGRTIKGNALNPVQARVLADDLATMPRNMKGGTIDKAMDPGKMSLAPGHQRSATTKDNLYFPTNPQFNHKTKQIFAALNYGRRAHGSNNTYGWSHFILDNKFKTNALFFAGDTFGCILPNAKGEYEENTKSMLNSMGQLTMDTIAALILYSDQYVRKDIIDSCLHAKTLKDTLLSTDLVEAHLFEPVLMRGGVTSAWVSGKDLDSSMIKADPTLWKRIRANALEFGRRTGVRVHFIDEP
jgi:hypothetical protein